MSLIIEEMVTKITVRYYFHRIDFLEVKHFFSSQSTLNYREAVASNTLFILRGILTHRYLLDLSLKECIKSFQNVHALLYSKFNSRNTC